MSEFEKWKPYQDECPNCGNNVEVLTEQDEEGWVYDSDPVRCVECKQVGSMVVAAEDDVYISWHDDEEVE